MDAGRISVEFFVVGKHGRDHFGGGARGRVVVEIDDLHRPDCTHSFNTFETRSNDSHGLASLSIIRRPTSPSPVFREMERHMASALATLTECITPQLEAVERLFDRELQSELAGVNVLVKHVSRFRGKMLRPTLLLLWGKACGELTDAHVTVATVVEMVHMATLVHDDVLDEAELRRKGATLNHLRGNEAAVLLGDFLISHSYHLCSSLDSQFASRLIGRTTNEVCEGELLQIDNRNNLDLDEETYLSIISRKTASLTAACCLLGAKLSGADDRTVRRADQFGRSLGIAFQIQDDILDIVGDVQDVGKTLGIDLEKVKLTLPIIH